MGDSERISEIVNNVPKRVPLSQRSFHDFHQRPLGAFQSTNVPLGGLPVLGTGAAIGTAEISQ